jgi:hypothetical protein
VLLVGTTHELARFPPRAMVRQHHDATTVATKSEILFANCGVR